jgi:hypothetical protein
MKTTTPKHTLAAVIASICVFSVTATDSNIPSGYYNGINGKQGAALKTAVRDAIYNRTEVSNITSFYNALPQCFQRTDVYPESSRWWDMYSDIPLYVPNFSGVLQREHSLPKSWWGGSTEIPAYIDLNHLYPAEASANQAKSNYPLGTVDMSYEPSFDNGVSKVGYAVTGQGGGAKYVFEPADEYKGDFARTYFYMATCYQDLTWKYTYMLSSNTYPTLNAWSQELLLKWANDDPVSQKEIDRNEEVYKIQANRNPFIDFPNLAEYIWGSHKGEAFYLTENSDGSVSGNSGTPNIITPAPNTELDFGEVAIGQSSTAKLHLTGENLTGTSLTLAIYDRDDTNGAAMFNIDGSSRFKASVSSVNSSNGLWVTVTYTPTELGEHTTRLAITGGGITGSFGIGLSGECLPVPTLSAPTATAATNITSDSYTANWTPAPGDVVDYYVVNRTKFIGGDATTEQLVAEDTSLEIEDFCGSESYTVQAVRLNTYSAVSNTIYVNTSSIVGVQAPQAIGAKYVEGGVRIACPGSVSNLRILDTAGRTLRTFDSVDNGEIILLPCGIYFITADGVTSPIKFIVQ